MIPVNCKDYIVWSDRMTMSNELDGMLQEVASGLRFNSSPAFA
jgi:hypothetical protein